MSLPTCAVTVRCYNQSGQPDPGAVVVARLNHPEVYQGYVIPDEVQATADASGVAVLTLFRNALGSTASRYTIRIEGTSGSTVRVNAVVPDAASVYLEDIADLPPYAGKPDPILDLTGFATLTGAESLENKELVNPAARAATLVDGASIDWDADGGQMALLTLSTTQDTRVLNNPSHLKSGSLYMLVITQNPNGGQTITTWGSAYILNGATINSAPDSQTVLVFLCIGTSLYALNVAPPAKVDSPPTNTVPDTQSTAHDTQLVFNAANGNEITVADSDSATVTTVVSVTSGTLAAAAGSGATVTNDNTASVTITGAPDNVTAALYGLTFTPTTGFSGSVTLTVETSDDTSTVTKTVSINVAAASGNNPPVNTVPGAQAAAYGAIFTFSTATGNKISTTDADGDALTCVVSVDSGLLSAVTGGGATITNNNTASVTIAGTIAQVNAALDGLRFAPDAGFTGAVMLTVATDDGTDTDTDTVTINVAAAAATQADTVQTPLVRHPVDWLVAGNYVFSDGRWGFRSKDSTQEPSLTEGPASYQFQQFLERSLVVNSDGSVAGTWDLRWPEYNVNNHKIDGNQYYQEVKTYPSICYGLKPGFFGSDQWPAFSFVVRNGDGVVVPNPTPSYTPAPIKADWQPAGGSVVTTYPSGATPGSTPAMPMQLPLTGKTCRSRGKLRWNAVPTGRGHIAFDYYLTATGDQVKDYTKASITHEIMVPLSLWGHYGEYGYRNPGWYDHDVTIDGIQYHVYCTKNLPNSPWPKVLDANGNKVRHPDDPGPNAEGYYPGLQYNFSGLDPNYDNEECPLTGGGFAKRIGWKFIILEPFGVTNAYTGGLDHPVDADGYFVIDWVKIMAHLATCVDERGVPWIQNTEYLPSLECGAEMVWGTAKYSIYNYLCQCSNTADVWPAKPTFTNHAPVNTVPAAQTVVQDTEYVFSSANNNLISVADNDNDTLTTTLSVDSGTLTATVVAGEAIVAGNGTAAVKIIGKPSQVNASLASVTYTPEAAYTGSATLTVTTTDGVAQDQDTVALTVQSASQNAPALLQAQFDAPNNNAGFWLKNILADLRTSANAVPSSWAGAIKTWKTHAGVAGRDFVEPTNTSYPSLATDAGGFNYVNIYTGEAVVGASPSTNAFYGAITLDDRTYNSVLASTMNAANVGWRLRYSGDGPDKFYLDVGTGSATVTLSISTPWAGTFRSPGGAAHAKHVIEFWYDGTNIGLRLDKSATYVATQALGAAMAAGSSDVMLGSDYPQGTSQTVGYYYSWIMLDGYCPPSGDRDVIAAWAGAEAGLTL